MTDKIKICENPALKQIAYYNRSLCRYEYTDNFFNESEYRYSEVWRNIRSTVLKRDKFQCVKCGTGINLQVHHIRYPDVWGLEKLDTLISVCDKCHSEIHEIDKENKK